MALGGTVAADEDLVRIPRGGGAPTLVYDGSAQRDPGSLDLDGADRLDDGRLLLSFGGTGTTGGVSFADEDAPGTRKAAWRPYPYAWARAVAAHARAAMAQAAS